MLVIVLAVATTVGPWLIRNQLAIGRPTRSSLAADSRGDRNRLHGSNSAAARISAREVTGGSVREGPGSDPPPALSVVIPAYNEASTVRQVIISHLSLFDAVGIDAEILILDDGSTDGTSDAIASVHDPRVVPLRHARNRGIAPTLLELYGAARGRWIYYLPADDQIPAEALERIWSARQGTVCVVGRRVPRADPPMHRIIAFAYSTIVRSLFKVPVTDIDSVKLIDAPVLRSLRIASRSSFSEAELLVQLSAAGGTIREVSIPHQRRRHGTGRGATPTVIVRTMVDLVRFALRSRRREGSRTTRG